MTLDQLEHLRAARQDGDDLPHTMTQREVRAYVAATALLDHRITTARDATATLAALPSLDEDARWVVDLNTWRASLCTELLTIRSPIREKAIKEQSEALTWSIRLIDFGLSISTIGPVVDLSSTRVGLLMDAAGYTPTDPHGPRGWRGSIKEVEHRIKVTTRQHAAAQAVLDDALMDDDHRAQVEAESARRCAVLNGMHLTGSDGRDGLPYHLVPHRADGSVIDLSELTDEQREALDRINAAEAAREAARRAPAETAADATSDAS